MNGKTNSKPGINELLDSIFRDRTRTNLLRAAEQAAIAFFVRRIPPWISSNMLTAIGFLGSLIVFLSFILATYFDRTWLLLGIPGFMISWFGDSLDGRMAYYRKTPRKIYGFGLDITIDWLSIITIGAGYLVYSEGVWELLGYGFVVMYGWEIIIALLRYKITGIYSIDSGKFGPTEARIAVSIIMMAEVFYQGSINYSSVIAVLGLFIINILDTRRLLKIADEIDKNGKEKVIEITV